MSTLTWKESRYLKCPLTDDEVRERGQALAHAIKQRDELAAEQMVAKNSMKDAMQTAEGAVAKLAHIVNERTEERTVQVELRVNLGLRLVEEVRMDSGEIIATRTVTEDDKLRAQMTLDDVKPPKDTAAE